MMDGLLLDRVVRKAPLKRSHLSKHLSKVRKPTRRESMKNVPGRGISVKALNRKKLDRVKEEQGGPCGWRKINEKKSHERLGQRSQETRLCRPW